jgi:hypothetical protein
VIRIDRIHVLLIGLVVLMATGAMTGSAQTTDSYIVIGEEAQLGDLVAALHLADAQGIPLRNILMDSDNIPAARLFLIGGGSVNKVSDKVGYAMTSFILQPVIIETKEHNGHMVTILAGYEAADTRSAVEAYIDSAGST